MIEVETYAEWTPLVYYRDSNTSGGGVIYALLNVEVLQELEVCVITYVFICLL